MYLCMYVHIRKLGSQEKAFPATKGRLWLAWLNASAHNDPERAVGVNLAGKACRGANGGDNLQSYYTVVRDVPRPQPNLARGVCWTRKDTSADSDFAMDPSKNHASRAFTEMYNMLSALTMTPYPRGYDMDLEQIP